MIESCITRNNKRCNSDAFISRKVYSGTDSTKGLDEIRHEDIKDIDNGEIYEWYQIGTDKYMRSMYCSKTKTLRTQTMGEFYGGSIVD